MLRKIMNATMVAAAAGGLLFTGTADADAVNGPLTGGNSAPDEDHTTAAQHGRQNRDRGNSTGPLALHVLERGDRVTRCVAVDNSHHSPTYIHGNTQARGGTSPSQVNVAQSGKQNLNCGNSADLITVNVLSDVKKQTRCVTADHSSNSPVHAPGNTQARGGTSPSQVNVAQNGRQNLNCGKSADLVTVP